MKRILLLPLAVAVLNAACGRDLGRQIQETVRVFDNLRLRPDQIEVENVQPSGKEELVAEIRVRTAVRMLKKGDKWVIEEIRLGDRHWEKAEHVLAVLNQRRSSATLSQMHSIAEKVLSYSKQHGQLPQVSSFESLIDVLSPEHLAQAIRLDAWSQPYSYRALSSSEFELRSAAADGQFGTPDDLIVRSSGW
ncbi:MAG: type II secretion system protein GspG [Acidobacteria bacterium]|nr:type II secretion system protein GspG [Acidobacteriota bacterium]